MTKGAFGVTVNVVDGVATVLGVHKLAEVVGLEHKNGHMGENQFEARKKVDMNQIARKIGMALGIIGILCVIAFFGYKHYSKVQRSKYGQMTSDNELTSHPASYDDAEKAPKQDLGNMPTITSPVASTRAQKNYELRSPKS